MWDFEKAYEQKFPSQTTIKNNIDAHSHHSCFPWVVVGSGVEPFLAMVYSGQEWKLIWIELAYMAEMQKNLMFVHVFGDDLLAFDPQTISKKAEIAQKRIVILV